LFGYRNILHLLKSKFVFTRALHKILLLFIVGYISRGVVNDLYDVNVFKDYMSGISLIYYGSMALFSVVVHSFPEISFKDCFNKFLVILFVGLVFRGAFNYLYDVNTFKDYISIIYLTDCGLMALFSNYINNLPGININIFNINVIKESIR